MGTRVKGKGYRVGEIHHRAKLTDHDVDLIIELREKYKLTYTDIAEKFDVSLMCISLICRGSRRSRRGGRVTH